ncbi:hypothetical protein ANCCAN_04119 [Ancylostoma caninum]|uniref:Uncharacterized protein n=1 Tax=Ancylostoma caninum TaxID=29170 RepID=A0A368GZT0_ANCCA|nr:hypothetical protein ANCCAN_04119 [Ancylostoma caninum]
MVGLIGTHNGKFHCDEVFACFMLKRLNQFRDYNVLRGLADLNYVFRTRDPATLETCEVVVDVGGVYDHAKKRYDHHQKEFNETMQSLGVLDFNTKLSSAGLIYAHYGRQLIAEILGCSHNDRMVGIFYRKLYETFVEAIDAVDNGIPQYDGIPRYHMSGGLSGRVGHLNPHWNEVDPNPDERFQQAMDLVGGEFESNVSYLANVWWPAREIVEKAIDEAAQVDKSGRILYISTGGVPWKEHFFELEEEKGLSSRRMTYIIYEDSSSGTYRIQAIPNNRLSTFDNRMPLPKAWRGLRDDELSSVSGIDGCIFTHMTGFIGGNKTLEGAVEMARKAIEIGDAEAAASAESELEVKKMKLDAAENNGVENIAMDDRLTKIAGTAAITATVVGVGAAATYICTKHLRTIRRQNENVSHALETLSSEVHALRREIAELRIHENGVAPRTPSKNRNRVRSTLEGGGGDAPSTFSRNSLQYGRVASYQSFTSDTDYADAEEEWDNEAGDGQRTEQASTRLPPMSFAEVDKFFGTENVRPGYDILEKRYEAGDRSSELLWRLARFCHELACRTTDKEKKKELIFEGKRFALEGLEANDDDFNAIKWSAIMTGQSTDYMGTKEKIEESGKFKDLLDKALAKDSKEFSLLHMRGRYSYSVANLSWIERKAAAMFYGTPPTATIDEALEDLLAAYEEKPEWIENLFYIARIYLDKGDKENAKKFFSKVVALTPVDEEERDRVQEANKLLAKC